MKQDAKESKGAGKERPIADGLYEDVRVLEAKRLLLEAVFEHQQKIHGICPPIAGMKQSYEEMLARFAEIRGAKLWFPFIGSGIGKGALVELADGSVKYDFICGVGAHYFGHTHLDLISSGIDAAISDTVMQGNLQQNADSIALSSLLTFASGLDHCFLTTSGAMANENALKIAFQKRFPAQRVLAFEHCFAGRTLAISQITDKAAYRDGLPPTLLVDYLPFFDPERAEESTKSAIDTLKKYLYRHPKGYAAMCFEFIQGEGGFYHGASDFFKAIMSLLRDNEIAVFADEVQSFGRLPELFAYQYYGLGDYIDIASVGKLAQVSATLYSDAYNPKPGLISQTFTGSTSAIKSSKIILSSLLEGNYFGPEGKIQQLHDYFAGHLERLSIKHPHLIKGPFGLGSMIAFTPYGGDHEKVVSFVHRLFHAGVIGFIAGLHPTRVRFLIPAGVVTFDDIDHVVSIIEETLLKPMES